MTASSPDRFDFFAPPRQTGGRHARPEPGARGGGRHRSTAPGADPTAGSVSGSLSGPVAGPPSAAGPDPRVPAQTSRRAPAHARTGPARPAFPARPHAQQSQVQPPPPDAAETTAPAPLAGFAPGANTHGANSANTPGADLPGATAPAQVPTQAGARRSETPRVRRQRISLATPGTDGAGEGRRASRPAAPLPASTADIPDDLPDELAAADDPAESAEQGEDSRILVASGAEGLGRFDLGTVPASVTPPPTWRKAAWFASLSSGAVVVALLVAGTLFVGPGNPTNTAEGWPDRHGAVAPLIPDDTTDRGGRQAPEGSDDSSDSSDSSQPSDSSEAARTSDESSSAGGDTPNTADPLRNPPGQSSSPSASETPDPSAPSESAPGSSGPSSPSSSTPTKPPSTPAPTETATPVYFSNSHDPEVMAKRSQAFLDQVTEDPQAAHELTSGQLREQGPQRLERAYAGIAYFEVTHIYIDQNEGVTENTVRVTYEDGSTEEQTRQLTFDDDEKISADGT